MIEKYDHTKTSCDVLLNTFIDEMGMLIFIAHARSSYIQPLIAYLRCFAHREDAAFDMQENE